VSAPEFQVVTGDSLEILKLLRDDSVDAMVTDPPAGIGFMGREWDSDKGGRTSWIAWLESVAREALRAMKPGAHGLVWALPRTSHWTATALEQAGFEIRDVINHHFGTGFPKSLNVSKAIDEAAGAEREVVGEKVSPDGIPYSARHGDLSGRAGGGIMGESVPVSRASELITAPATEAARQWDGWGTALKPATEHWILVRKPLAGTVAANVQEHGTGALNIDATRIDGGVRDGERGARVSGDRSREEYRTGTTEGPHADTTLGRWPANLVLSHTEWCGEELGCLPGCPVALLDAQSGTSKDGLAVSRDGKKGGASLGCYVGKALPDRGFGGAGGASRFFYVSKPSTKEREDGLAHLPKKSGGEIVDRAEDSAGINNPRAGAGRTAKGRANFHPTVKSIGLMSWLVRLISPPGGVVLDPFCGSGSTGVAALLGGWNFLGIEKDPEYATIANARIAHAAASTVASTTEATKAAA
jgi:hypothetical protein